MLFFDKEARRKAAILLMSAFNAGQCIDLSRSAWLVHDLQTSHFVMAELLELQVKLPKNKTKKRAPLLTRQEGCWFFKKHGVSSPMT
jgi:hypothetical protein